MKYAMKSHYLPFKAEIWPKLTIYLRYKAGENRYSMERIRPHRLFEDGCREKPCIGPVLLYW